MMCCHITIETAIDEIELKRMMTYIGAVSICAKALLLRETSVREYLKDLLPENKIEDIDNALHSPNFCLDVLGHYLAKQVLTKKLELPTNALIYSCGVLQISKAVGKMEKTLKLIHSSYLYITPEINHDDLVDATFYAFLKQVWLIYYSARVCCSIHCLGYRLYEL